MIMKHTAIVRNLTGIDVDSFRPSREMPNTAQG